MMIVESMRCNLIAGLQKVSKNRRFCTESHSIVSLGLREVLAKLNSRELSSLDLTNACLQNIKEKKHLNAFITVTADMALQQAKESDRRRQQGKKIGLLDGVPVAVKDNYSTKGILTTCASKMLEDYIPPYTATVVQRLLDEGAILIGKANMDEFAMGSASVTSHYGPVLHPWTTDVDIEDKDKSELCIAGGSSGGSACAVAAHLCFGALGSDTGGSTRFPASLCGIVGYMPSYGRTSRYGLVPLASSLDCPAIFAKSVEDASLMADAISGHDPLDCTSANQSSLQVSKLLQNRRHLQKPLEGVRVGIPKEYYIDELAPENVNIWRQAAKWVADAGAEVLEVSLPHTRLALACYYAVCNAEMASNLAKYDGLQYGHRAVGVDHSTDSLYGESRAEGFRIVTRNRIRSGTLFLSERMYGEYYTMAAKVRRLIAQDFYSVLGKSAADPNTRTQSCATSNIADVLLYPTTAHCATTFGKYQLGVSSYAIATDIFACPVNLAGLPAVSIPVGLSKKSMPLGLQVVGPRFGELVMTQVALAIEDCANFSQLCLHLVKNQSNNTTVTYTSAH